MSTYAEIPDLYKEDLNRAAEAFRSNPKCRRLPRDLWSGKRACVMSLQLTETVLLALGEDMRGWRDWDECVREASNVVLKEWGFPRRRKRRT